MKDSIGKLEVRTALNKEDQAFVLETSRKVGELTQVLARELIRLKDEAVCKALVEMGWTPPNKNPWLPIETAPKDGTRILLLCDAYGGCKIVEGRWLKSGLDIKDRWHLWEGRESTQSTEHIFPTHWMIKPFPPCP